MRWLLLLLLTMSGCENLAPVPSDQGWHESKPVPTGQGWEERKRMGPENVTCMPYQVRGEWRSDPGGRYTVTYDYTSTMTGSTGTWYAWDLSDRQPKLVSSFDNENDAKNYLDKMNKHD